jgi:hypothetical protein
MDNLQLEYKKAKIQVAVAMKMFSITPFPLEISHSNIQESAILANFLTQHVYHITTPRKYSTEN